MSAGPRWMQIRERGSLLGLRLFIGCYRLFGRPLTVVTVHVIVFYYYLTIRSARRASRAYLRRIAARPDGAEALGRPPDWLASFWNFRAFALEILDRLVLWFGRESDLEFEVIGDAAFQRLRRKDRGAIVVGAHLGSFDALRALAEQDDVVVNVLMFTRNAPRINAILEELSPRARVRVLESSFGSIDTVLRIRACIARGELVAMLGDRVEPGGRTRSCRVSFLGDPVELPEAPYLMAGLIGCPLFFMVALRAGPGRYRVFAELLTEDLELPRGERDERVLELAATYAGRLEHYCTLAPYQWFNFFDFWREGP